MLEAQLEFGLCGCGQAGIEAGGPGYNGDEANSKVKANAKVRNRNRGQQFERLESQ